MLAFVLALAFAQSPTALVDSAVELSNRGQFAQAAERLVQALALNPNLSEAHYLLGLIRQTDGRREAAVASFRQAARLDPRHPAAPARICELETWFALVRESGFDQAAALCRRALALAPGDAESHFHLGRNYAKRGNAPAALESLRTALLLDPKLPGVRFELALAYLDAQNPAAAVPLLKDVVAAEPANGNARFQLGSALAKQGDCAGALPQLELATPSAQKHYVLATCYAKLNQIEDAQRERARAAEFRTGADALVQAKFRAAVAQKKEAAGQLDQAIADYRAALALAPDLSIKIDLAVALLKQGDAAAVKTLLAGETDPLARYQLALAEDKAEARAILESIVRDRPSFVEAWYQLGVTLVSLHQPQDAEQAFAKAVELRADEPALRRAWAEALERNGRAGEAAEQRRLAGPTAARLPSGTPPIVKPPTPRRVP